MLINSPVFRWSISMRKFIWKTTVVYTETPARELWRLSLGQTSQSITFSQFNRRFVHERRLIKSVRGMVHVHTWSNNHCASDTHTHGVRIFPEFSSEILEEKDIIFSGKLQEISRNFLGLFVMKWQGTERLARLQITEIKKKLVINLHEPTGKLIVRNFPRSFFSFLRAAKRFRLTWGLNPRPIAAIRR